MKPKLPTSKQSIARVAVMVVVAPSLLFVFGRAAMDGELRRRDALYRAALDDETVDAANAGTTPALNYLATRNSPELLRLPRVEGTDTRGKPFNSVAAIASKKRVVINFWSRYCEPCIEEMPSLEMLSRVIREQELPIELITINVDPKEEDATAVVPTISELRVLHDQQKQIAGRFGTKQYPETWIADERGIIRARVDGPRDWSSALMVQFILGL